MALHRRTRRQNPHFITERPLSVNHGAHLDRSGDRAVALRRLRRRRIEAQHLVERLHRLAARREHLHARVVAEARTGRDEPADDHVLLQTAQVVGFAGDRRLGEHARRLLERRRRDEAVGRERRLRDTEEHGLGRGRPITRSFSSWNTNLSTSSPTTNSVSPTSSMRTRRSIWRTMISMCLSLIVTPCRRYTSCTSLTRYFWSSRSPSTAR